ncbi:MAG: alpha/beta hydrolase [Myxococcota bacterium]
MILLWGLMACRPTPADAFFVSRDGALLPVWIRGDLDAETFIVVQHGSGASGWVYDWMFDDIEAAHAVVYWDQRGAGQSTGNAPDDTLNLDASVQDLQRVVDTLIERQDPGRVILLGHSLGGGLSMDFLRRSDRARTVDGYIDVSGGRSLPDAYALARDEMIAQCQQRTRGDDPWAECVDFYVAQARFPRQEPARSTHSDFVDAVLSAQGYDQAAATREMQAFLSAQGAREAFLGPFDVFAYGANTRRFLDTFDLDGVDLSVEDISAIDVPARIIAGAFDLAVPPEMSAQTADALGTSPVILDGAGHFPMWDRPDAFGDAVLSFLETLP